MPERMVTDIQRLAAKAAPIVLEVATRGQEQFFVAECSLSDHRESKTMRLELALEYSTDNGRTWKRRGSCVRTEGFADKDSYMTIGNGNAIAGATNVRAVCSTNDDIVPVATTVRLKLSDTTIEHDMTEDP